MQGLTNTESVMLGALDQMGFFKKLRSKLKPGEFKKLPWWKKIGLILAAPALLPAAMSPTGATVAAAAALVKARKRRRSMA